MRKTDVRGLLFTAPALILLVVFYILPIAVTVGLSLFKVEHFMSYDWVGLANYAKLWGSGFVDSFRVSGKFLLAMLFYKLVISYLIAVALHFRSPKFSMAMRTVYYVPVVLSGVATISVWRWMFSHGGLINDFLGKLSLGPYLWLGDPDLAPWAIAFVVMMMYVGGTVLLWSAALGQVPKDVIDAARVDGAGMLRIIWNILTPLTNPTRLYITVVGFLGAIQIWEHPWLFTSGGPRASTTTVTLKIFNTAFSRGQFGLASAMTVVALLVCLVMALYLMRQGLV